MRLASAGCCEGRGRCCGRRVVAVEVDQWGDRGDGVNLQDATDKNGVGAVTELVVLGAEDRRLGVAQVRNAFGAGQPVTVAEARLALDRAASKMGQFLLLEPKDVHAEIRAGLEGGMR